MMMFARGKVSWKLPGVISLQETESYLSGKSGQRCVPWIWTTVCGVGQRCSHVVAPPDKSVLSVSYHRQIDVSVSSTPADTDSSQASCLENVPPGRTHTSSIHSFLRLSHVTSFLPWTFDPSSSPSILKGKDDCVLV